MVDPDDLRVRAAAYVKEYTGYELTIAGPVTLSFFPWLGADMRDVAIRHPEQTGFEPFATFEELGLKVRFLPLLQRQVEVGGVSASGGRVRLQEASRNAPARELRNIRLVSGGFGTADPNDLSIAFDVTGAETPLPVSLTSRMLLDLSRDVLELRDLVLMAADTTMNGRIEGRDIRQSATWDVVLKGDRVDLERLAPLFALPASQPPAAAAPASSPVAATLALDLAQLHAYGLRLSDVTVRAESRDGVLVAKPVRGSLYGGHAEFSLTRDERRGESVTRVTGGMKGVDLEPMLADLQQFRAFSGRADVRLDLTSRGSDLDRMRGTLGGDVSASVREGRIEGVDFVQMLVRAHAMAAQLRGRPAMAVDDPGEVTSFSLMTGRAAVRSGVATIRDVALESPLLRATGEGTANFRTEALDLVLRATTPETGDRVVPVAITGSFSEPRYAIQAGEMLKDAAKEELERQIKRGLQRLLRKP